MKFEPLLDLLEEEIPALKRGKTLFINQMPADAQFGALLKDSFSGTQIDGEIRGLRTGYFELAARGKNLAQAKNLAEEVSTALTMGEVLFDGIMVKSMRPLNEPVPYMSSIGNVSEFSVKFVTIYVIIQ